MRTRLAVLLAAGVLLPGGATAIQPDIDLTAIDEAIAIGRSAIATERVRLHRTYRIAVEKAPIDYLELVTPFRRIVLATQERAERGQRGFGQKDALALLATAPGELDVYVELTFHPFNTYVGVPDYLVEITNARKTVVEAKRMDRISRWTPRVDGLPLSAVPGNASAVLKAPNQQPLLGATVIATFDLRDLEARGRADIVVSEAGRDLARVPVDLGLMR
jgi:hypothetical protein